MKLGDSRADQGRVRRIAPFLVCIFLAAGCGQELKLRGIAARAVAADGRCSHTGASYDGPESLNCTYLTRGARMPVARAIARQLEDQGFEIGCRPDSEQVRVQGYTSTVRVTAVVSPRKPVYDAHGFPTSSLVHYGDPPIPRGSVLVELALDVHDATALDEQVVATAAPCGSPNAEPRTLPDCVRAWNVAANAGLHRSVAVARPRRLAAVGTAPVDGRNACAFSFRSGPRYLTIVGYWRGPGLEWATRGLSAGSWSPSLDDEHVPNAVVAPDGRLRLRSRR
jgi:hypothetical protein